MLKRSTLSLFLLVSFGTMQSMTLLHDIDTSCLGQQLHQVTVCEGNNRTVYTAYPKEALTTLEQRKLLSQYTAALSTTGFLYAGLNAITNAIANSWNYVTAAPSNAYTPRHVTAYIVLSGLSYALARYSWHAYDDVIKLYQRLMTYNTQDSLFASDIPATTSPETNHEIAAINAQNPNLIWVRASHEVIAPPAYSEVPLVAVAPPIDSEEPLRMYPHLDAGANIVTRPAPEQALVCSICLETINKRNSAANTALPCGHVFHTPCIRPIISNLHGTCPECQTPIANNNR